MSVGARAVLAFACVVSVGAVAYLTFVAPFAPAGTGPGGGKASPRWVTGTAATPGASPSGGRNPIVVDPGGVAMPRGDLPGWRLSFADDFSGVALDERWFAYDGQPDNDPGGWFDPSHVSVGGGLLTIGGWREPARRDLYVTGGVSNRNAVTQTYGRFDVRFRMDQGTGIAYALLLWPADNKYPPEIDFAEDNGRDRRTMYASVHAADGSEPEGSSVRGDFTQWHTASLEWTPGRLVFGLDGRVWHTITGAQVPSEPMALALQSQAWYCGHGWEACPDATTPERVNLQVDWVVSYAYDR
ncbi:glycoside hydrolase family 16 protein [Phytohabitans sp. ZYX-F-186]|uniref:Glycoside hydrolase family 16 protein n=1 Tax=Phytohabitans maris TaxID=3071409 RepID=A0ABU0ZMG4_9ACTN|nr:glycoside hydrolase family 16 protein [Phytohabitans sp. ZYX-F-186]MDQ7908234.1 glycoside hydrolase family 16 protein [Phytohabitans sp. ZYX-F-186]